MTLLQRCLLFCILFLHSDTSWSQNYQWRIDPGAQSIRQFVSFKDSSTGTTHCQSIHETPKSTEKPWVLVVHALWADKPGRQAAMFDRLAIKYPGHQVLMLVWETKGQRYKKQWAQAYVQGTVLGSALQSWVDPGMQFKALVHSAGHQVFRGILAKGPLPVSAVVLAAPDLSTSAFRELIQQLPGAEKTLLVHRRDKALLLSQWIHHSPRIGRRWEGQVPDGVQVEIHRGTLGGRDLLAHLYVWDTSPGRHGR